MDEHATVWTGTAFDCPETENQLTFLHSRFNNTYRGCNGGAISGSGIRTQENRYTSQVNITVDSDMDGGSVECFHENKMGKTLVKNFSIMITSGIATHNNILLHKGKLLDLCTPIIDGNLLVPFPPPTDIMVNITNISLTTGTLQLIFNWTPVAPWCSAIDYIITANNCSSCDSRNGTFVTATELVCTDVAVGSSCDLSIQTRACDSLVGNMSTVTLELTGYSYSLLVASMLLYLFIGPDAPLEVTNVLPVYCYEAKNLTKVIVIFNELVCIIIIVNCPLNGHKLYKILYRRSFMV